MTRTYTVTVSTRDKGTIATVRRGSYVRECRAQQLHDDLAFAVGRAIVWEADAPSGTVGKALALVDSLRYQLREAERRLATAQYEEYRTVGTVRKVEDEEREHT